MTEDMRDDVPLLGRAKQAKGSEQINQEELQKALGKTWSTFAPEQQAEIAYAFGLSVEQCGTLIVRNDFEVLFKNTRSCRRFKRTFLQSLKLLISFLAAGGGFKTGSVTAGIATGIGSSITPVETTMLNAAGGAALMTFFATGDYSETGKFISQEWQKSGPRTAAYLLMLVLNASLSGFFAYTGAAGTMNVFGFALDNLVEQETIGGVLAGSNFVANLALTGAAAKNHQSRKANSGCAGRISFVYLVSMLMYIAGPFQANVGGVNDKGFGVKGAAALLTFVSIFYSAVVMLPVLDDPRKVYKDELKKVFEYIKSCDGLVAKSMTGTYFLIMFGLIFSAMTFLFASNNISAVMWGINDVASYLPEHASNHSSTNSTMSTGIDFSQIGPETMGLVVYSIICLLGTVLMVGAITLGGIHSLLRGFEPYGLSQMMQRKIMLKATTLNNDTTA